jgi:hypothetical protein
MGPTRRSHSSFSLHLSYLLESLSLYAFPKYFLHMGQEKSKNSNRYNDFQKIFSDFFAPYRKLCQQLGKRKHAPHNDIISTNTGVSERLDSRFAPLSVYVHVIRQEIANDTLHMSYS